MTFQINALPAEAFTEFFAMSDAELKAINATRMVVQSKPGSPCRVSLADAEIGETVVLLNYEHQPADSPYKASHAIFVREGVAQMQPKPDTVSEVMRSRVISLRLFDAQNMMIDADVVDGTVLAAAISKAFEDRNVAYAHLHNAKPGCFAASVTRID